MDACIKPIIMLFLPTMVWYHIKKLKIKQHLSLFLNVLLAFVMKTVYITIQITTNKILMIFSEAIENKVNFINLDFFLFVKTVFSNKVDGLFYLIARHAPDHPIFVLL